uniref:Lipoprotein-releasing ABC transporter permease subunit LolC n=1 Tax=Candidatus Aschnera chinzeii TaxID=1485666 RepID=A0AAT9G4X1_9ENTR|nr:MAG: lipoprotein-releasing ABC transporter permease subunit LolC [Candidatus Aschnera chinzeii]
MFQRIVFFISSRYMYSKINDSFCKFLYWLYVIGITLSVMGFIVITSVMSGFEYKLKNNILNYTPHVILTTSKGHLNTNEYPIHSFTYLRDVIDIIPIINSNVILQSKYSLAVANMIGIDKTSKDPLLKYLCNAIDASILTSGDYQIILGSKLADKLKVKQGEQIRLIIPGITQITIIGKIPSQRLFTVVGFFDTNNEFDDNIVLVHQNDAARVLHYPINNITGWRLLLHDPFKVDVLSHQQLPIDMIWKDWRAEKGEFFQAVNMEKNMIRLLLNLIAVVAAFNIIGSVSLLVIEKRKEIAILQTLGLKKKQFFIIFMIHGLFIAVIGTIIGIILGLLVVYNINVIIPMFGFLDKHVELPIFINYANIILISLSSLLISLISTIFPAWKAITMQPIETLRYE